MQLEKVKDLTRQILSKVQSDSAMELFNNLEQGKMLRSQLILAICDSEAAYNLCAIVELIQSASLLHDDVIDGSDLRRGKPSINAIFGNKSAIMLGDILYSSAFFELSNFTPLVIQSIAQSVSCLSIGELEDVKLEASFNANADKYLNMIKLKSASLIAASSECAAILANAKEPKKYYKYGENLGIAFQIIDDILDITQDREKLGKPALSDFKSGKSTLPYIYLYDEMDAIDKEWLVSLFGQELDFDNFTKLKEKLSASPLSRARAKAKEYGDKAAQIAKELGNNELQSMVTAMLERDV
ncbi:polyprenyl synthetase family protein [Helicobacter saguini]|uniref:Polyprenyl synthetase family protein n=1 Tax=Helicobacter saguini TaxID=1548018 RepID=A0A6L7DAQ0_9HELI|nr:polyprenyl synthetase family protein [Helicobacter saguini]MWV68909.1 polyprenyl synthetase family protein [Helicobacter saguini]